MKKITILMTLIFLSNSYANSELPTKLLGSFVHKHSIVAFYYQTKESCEDDGGKYEEGERTCFFKNIEDNFDINETSTNNIDVTISKIGYNFHMCDFQAPGKLVNDKLIVSKVEENGCEVQINLIDNNAVSISANTQCQFYCGAGMSLDTEQAVRVNKPL